LPLTGEDFKGLRILIRIRGPGIYIKKSTHQNGVLEMKQVIFLILAIFIGCMSLDAVSVSFALDEGGCLTCHRFPGLVRQAGDDGFKVLHIDEARYVRSAHGKTDCRQCHTRVTKVPHTGEISVNCNTKCHLEIKQKDRIKNFPLKSIHKQEQSFIKRLDDETACRVCHPLYPHSENKLVRALLNMHTGFMLCEVCHLKKESVADCTYDWNDTENATFSGEPFGTYYNPKTDKSPTSEHFISRIAVFAKDNGNRVLVIDSKDVRQADEFLLKEKSLSTDQKTQALDYFHRQIAKKEISVACDECHSSHSILNFRHLGFDPKKTHNLMVLNIKGLVTKYETFYFPQMLRP